MRIQSCSLALLATLGTACGETSDTQTDPDAGLVDGGNPLQPCEEGAATITGSVDNQPVSVAINRIGANELPTSSWVRFFPPDPGGFLYASTSTSYADRSGVDAFAVLVMPDANGGDAFCSGSPFTEISDDEDETETVIAVAGKLGSCSDAEPSPDRFEVCVGLNDGQCDAPSGGTARTVVTATISGETLELSEDPSPSSIVPLPSGEVIALFANGRGATVLTPTSDGYEGYLLWRDTDPMGPARLYCVEQAKANLDEMMLTMTFEQMRLRGDCTQPTPASGQLTVCY